jgi:hypothetical protein
MTSTWGKLADKDKPKKGEEESVAPPIAFQKLTPEMTIKKLKIGIRGQQKTGKTRWAMSSAVKNGPTYIIATEPGVKPLAKLFPNCEIYFCEVYEPDYTGIFEVEATKTLANIDQAVRQIRKLAIENPEAVKTVVVDSVTDVWKWVQEWMKMEILKIDKTARVKQQWDWGYANTKYQNIIMQLISLPCHVILTAQDREEYAGAGQPSGEWTARWQNQTPYWVDIVIALKKMKDKVGQVHYMAEIEDSRHMDENMNPIAGKTFENFTFDMLVDALTKKT